MTNETISEPEVVAVGPGRAEAAEPIEDGRAPLSSAEYTVAFTPRQVALGLAIVAGVVAFALSRRRRRRAPDEGD